MWGCQRSSLPALSPKFGSVSSETRWCIGSLRHHCNAHSLRFRKYFGQTMCTVRSDWLLAFHGCKNDFLSEFHSTPIVVIDREAKGQRERFLENVYFIISTTKTKLLLTHIKHNCSTNLEKKSSVMFMLLKNMIQLFNRDLKTGSASCPSLVLLLEQKFLLPVQWGRWLQSLPLQRIPQLTEASSSSLSALICFLRSHRIFFSL